MKRREFLKDIAILGGAAATGLAQTMPDWKKQVGLELFTVRDAMQNDFEGVLAKVASFGYKEVEPAGGYNNMSPKDFRGMLDRYGLSMPSTHSGATAGPDLDKQLEGFQIMGMKYTEVVAPNPNRGGGGGGRGRGPGGPAARTSEDIKRQAQLLNENGKVVQKFGMKILVHNHTQEFAPLADKPAMKPYDVLIAETDPSLVALQLDIGWASVAGEDILAMFKKSPGRFELWHVKDAKGIKAMASSLNQSQRQQAADLVPVGLGEVDYKSIFAAAQLAGMKHYCIEQDNAAQWGDSVAAAHVSLNGLVRLLS